jgi:HEAT repeat protein
MKGVFPMLRRISTLICLAMICTAVALAQEERTSKADAATPEDEPALIAVLENPEAGWQAKHEACRALRQIGTEASIPALAALLSEPELSHMARFALEPMPHPAAGEALRAALEGASDDMKIGLIITLGARRDAEAAPLLTPLLDGENVQVATAAAGALGHIATPSAVEALSGARASAPESLLPALHDALLAAAGYRAASGDAAAAEVVYTALLTEETPQYVRLGAWRGLAYADPGKTAEIVIAALQEEDGFREIAAQTVAETTGAQETRAYANALAELPPDAQVLLAHALALRGDGSARGAVLALAGTQQLDAQCAAVKALGALGTAEDVPGLVAWLASEEPRLEDAANTALQQLGAPGTEEAMVAAVEEATPPVRASLLDALTNRMSPHAVPAAMPYLDAPEAEVREAALGALAQLGDLDEAPAMADAVIASRSAAENNLALRALGSVAARHQNGVLPVVQAAMDRAEPEARAALLGSLERIGTEEALAALVTALDNEAATVGDEAVRVLANWPTPAAAPHLLTLAQGEASPRQETAFQGYVKLARQESAPDKKAEMLSAAMGLATKTQQRFQVLSAWSTLNTVAALDAVLPYLEDAEVRNEAGAAIVTIATALDINDETQRARAIEALEAVLAQEPTQGLRDRTEKALAERKQ